MVIYNAVTGLRRRQDRSHTTRKKRNSLSSTVSSRLYGKQAIEAFSIYLEGTKQALTYTALMNSPFLTVKPEQRIKLQQAWLLSSADCYSKAARMLLLESELLDCSEEQYQNAGYKVPLKSIRLDDYQNNDECADKTRFTKEQITMILDKMELPTYIRVTYSYVGDKPKYYKFHREELMIYLLRKFLEDATHKHMASGDEFGGDDHRWAVGYNWMLKEIHDKLCPLISPQALRVWAPQFPFFAEKLRKYLIKAKDRFDNNNHPIILQLGDHHFGPGEFNIFSVTDCTVYEVCRPGSGPARGNSCERREGWYIKQRAFYDGYHRGMEACVKILTLLLPNGLTASIYGPTSGRKEDKTLFRLAEYDEFLLDLCQEFHDGDIYCTYGDGIFAGYWFCLRTAHQSSPLMPLTPYQEEENQAMKGVRIPVEWSYGKVEQMWPILNTKTHFKIDQNADNVFMTIRVAYLLANLKICCLEGSTGTGTRGFECPPPSLPEYLNMLGEIEE